jgi:hypothetical protein
VVCDLGSIVVDRFEPGGAAQLHDGYHMGSPQSTTVPNHADHAI